MTEKTIPCPPYLNFVYDENAEPYIIEPTKYVQGIGRVAIGIYEDTNTALHIINEHGQIEVTASVNLPACAPLANHIWTKGWAENEGIPQALEKIGVITLTGKEISTGFVSAELARLSDVTLKAVQEFKLNQGIYNGEVPPITADYMEKGE